MADTSSGSTAEEINVKVKTMQPATYELRIPAQVKSCLGRAHFMQLINIFTRFSSVTPLQINVGALKDRLVEMARVPRDRQRIIYKGRVLDNDQQLHAFGKLVKPSVLLNMCHRAQCAHAGVQDGHTLHLVERAADAPPPAAMQTSPHTGQSKALAVLSWQNI